jgi:hypothetical protein
VQCALLIAAAAKRSVLQRQVLLVSTRCRRHHRCCCRCSCRSVNLWGLALCRGTVTYLDIHDDPTMTIGIFQLPPGSRMPLHDHPGMTVFSRCGSKEHAYVMF